MLLLVMYYVGNVSKGKPFKNCLWKNDRENCIMLNDMGNDAGF